MWIKRGVYEHLKGRSDQLERVQEAARRAVARELRARVDAEHRAAEMADKLVALANRPVQVVQPPDTAKIVKETVEGMATVLNGWKDQPRNEPIVQEQLSMDQYGFDARAGVPQSLEQFMPPWEENFPPPNQAEFVNARIGDYKPYVPGEGNTTQPKGGME